MMTAQRGRPPKSAQGLTRAAILAAAQARLDRSATSISLRQVAADLNVTAMALYTHVDGVDGILDALAAAWFASVPDPDPTSPRVALADLLVWYCARVLAQPRLTVIIVARRGALPLPHRTWTDRLRAMVAAAGASPLWADILVDHLHGFALSHAAGGTDPGIALAEFRRQLAVQIRALVVSGGASGPTD